MEARSWHLMLFSLCLFFSSGLVTAIRYREDENQQISSFEFNTQLDSIPTVNPTTPGSGNPYPTINPTSPQAPSTTGPTPTTPINPYITPTSPNTSPTTPTSPYTNPTTPTNPQYTIPPTPPSTTPTSPTANPITPTTPGGGGGSGGSGQWCIAGQSAAETTIKVALDYACGYGADCSAIQQGGSCYDPNTLKDHASYAFNDYYQKNPAPTSCAFGGAATLTNKDPSHGNCHYSSSKTTSMSPPTYVSPPTTPSPPSTMTPTTMTPPTPTTMTPSTPGFMTPTSPGMTMPDGTSSVYGSSPTGSPNTATSVSYSVLLLFTSIWAALHVENYI